MAPTADPCPLCAGREAELIASRARDGAALRTVACVGCGLLRSDPMPSAESLRSFYENEYRHQYKGVLEPKPKHVARAGALAASRLGMLSRYIKAGDRVLDIGSGGGEWLYLLERHGANATGVEPSAGYAEFARREYGVNVSTGCFDRVCFAAGDFDVVTLFHVLEHLPDPVSALKTALSWLTEDGCLIVEVPNMASPHQHPRKRFHPAHVVGFTPRTLAAAAMQAEGFAAEIRVDSFARNVTAVIRRSGGARPNGPMDASACILDSVRPGSLFGYYASPVTLYRFTRRIAEFGREYVRTWRRRTAREILDALPIVQGRGDLKGYRVG